MQKSTPLPLGQSGARTGGGQGAVEAALDEIQWDDWLMSIADDESSHASTSRLWQTECSEEAQQSAHGGVNPDDLLIEAFMSALGQTTPSDMDPLHGFTAAPRKTSIPLPRTSTPVLGECEGQNVTSYMQLCLPGGLASIEGYSPSFVEEPFPDFEPSRWPASTVSTVIPASYCPPFVEADMELGYLLPSTGREQPMGYPVAEYAYQEPGATPVQIDYMLPTPEFSASQPTFPSQLDSQSKQPVGTELSLPGYQGLLAEHFQELAVDEYIMTLPYPEPSPARSNVPSQLDSQLEQVDGHWFNEVWKGSPRKPTYYCADSRCNGTGFGQRVGRKQDRRRHAMKTAGAAIINCAYWAGCNYRGNRRKDKVWAHERNEHGYHRDGCACRECKMEGK